MNCRREKPCIMIHKLFRFYSNSPTQLQSSQLMLLYNVYWSLYLHGLCSNVYVDSVHPTYVYEHAKSRVRYLLRSGVGVGRRYSWKYAKAQKCSRLSFFLRFFPIINVIGEKCELFSRVLFSHSGNGSTHGHIFTIYGSPSCDFTVWFWNKIVLKLSVE